MVDVLVLTPKGCYLVEIESWRGEIGGDAGTWEWVYDGRRKYRDNPRILAERKAKKLASRCSTRVRLANVVWRKAR